MSFYDQPWGLALGTGIGAILGAIGGYFLSEKLKNKEKMDEINEIRSFYEAKMNEFLAERPKNDVEIVQTVEEKDEKLKEKVPVEALDANGNPKNVYKCHPQIDPEKTVKYNKMYKPEDEKLKTAEIREDTKLDPYPHQIDYMEFRNNQYYAKHTLIYYEQSGVFATVGDELTSWTVEYFGLRNLEMFGVGGHWTIYVRDEMTKDDFEIIYDGQSTWEEVESNTGGAKD